jgi:hypothetical protein
MGSYLSLTLALSQHMDTQKYNGWTNYATWLCNLWFDDFTPLFEDHIEDLSDEHEDKADLLNTLEMWIKDDVNEYVESIVDERVGFVMDLVGSAFKDIDFRDIAEHYVDDVWDDIETHRLNQKEALAVA